MFVETGDWMLLDFGITDEDIAETTEEIGIGILERRIPSWEAAFPTPSPFVVTTAELAVDAEKLFVLVVGGCFDAIEIRHRKKYLIKEICQST